MAAQARKPLTGHPGKTHRRAGHPAHASGAVALSPAMQARFRKLAASAAALAMAGSLAAPLPAWAAEWVQVAGTEYTEAASGSGENGGSWSWDGADDLLLDNYSGTGILAEGDLTVTLEGKNDIGYTEDDYGSIYVENGDLTITGDGSLDVSENLYSAIETLNGDITIEGTTVSATTYWDSDEYYSISGAINATNGSVNIIDSTVNAAWVETGSNTGTAHAIYATTNSDIENGTAVDSSACTVNIVDSTVNATVHAPNRSENSLKWTRAIGAFSNVEGCTPTINIENSTVNASAPGGMALLAWSRGIDEAGVINIRNSTLPEGASARDICYEGSSGGSSFVGQVLATGSGTITTLYDPAILDSALIKPAESVVDPVEPVELPFATKKAYAATNDVSTADAALPATGDAMMDVVATAMAAMAAAGSALFGWKKTKGAR